MGAHAGFEIAGRPDRRGVEAFEFGLERLLGRSAALEGGEGLGERFARWNHLGDAAWRF
jgi:hypothetical protein